MLPPLRLTAELLVFDLDGTLINSRTDIANAANYTLAKYGLPPLSDLAVEKHVGTGVRPLIEQLLSEAGVEDPAASFAHFTAHYLAHLTDHTELYPGVADLLESLRTFPKVVLTNKSNQFTDLIMKKMGLDRHFSRWYGRESFSTRKPDAGPLIEIAKLNSLPPGELVMIGDTDVDVRAGQGAGTQTCAVLYGFGTKPDLLAMRPDHVVTTAQEMLGLFRRGSTH